jgi:hypothetical protein
MDQAVLGLQEPRNHAPGCPLATWSLVDLAAKDSTSYGPDGSSANLISSSSRYLARLSAKANWFLKSPGSKDPRHQSAHRGLDPRSTRQSRNQARLCPGRHQRLGPLIPWSLGIKLGKTPWSPGSLTSRSQGSRGPWRRVTHDHLGNWVPWSLGFSPSQSRSRSKMKRPWGSVESGAGESQDPGCGSQFVLRRGTTL